MKHERFTRLHQSRRLDFVVIQFLVMEGAVILCSTHFSSYLPTWWEEATRNAFRLMVKAIAMVALITMQVYDTWNGGIQD